MLADFGLPTEENIDKAFAVLSKLPYVFSADDVVEATQCSKENAAELLWQYFHQGLLERYIKDGRTMYSISQNYRLWFILEYMRA